MSSVLHLAVFFLAPVVVQLAAYFALARFGFRVPTLRALGIATVRVMLGVPLFWALVLLNLDNDTPVGIWLAISSPIAWAMAALLDPRRSVHRAVLWVLIGTALTFGVAEGYWRLLSGESMLDADTHYPFG